MEVCGNTGVPFHRPFIGEDEIQEVVATLRSGWLTTGPKVKQFESDFAAAVGARRAVAVNSATAGLHLALEAVGVGPGDDVVIPTYTFAATGEVVTYLGARPVLADCRADTFNVDVRTLEPAITPRTKAIIPVHIAGQACDMDPILELARARNVAVVEDAAHALPTTYRGRRVGSISELTVFSFYATKTITTGEGGMITAAREDHADRMRAMSLHGLSGDAWTRYTARGSWDYEIRDFGFKYNLTDIAAALGLKQLARAEEFHKRRTRIAEAYDEAFGALDTCRTPRRLEYGAHAWHLYILELDVPALDGGRDHVIRTLRAKGIGTSVHFKPLHRHPVYQKLGHRGGDFPIADTLWERVVSLPIYPAMTDADVERVVGAVTDTLQTLRR